MSHYHLPHNHGQDIEKVLDKMPAEENFREIAFLFQQLSDPSRLRLLWLLCHSEECVCNLAAAVDMSAPAISHHLKNLKRSGLITSRREGKEVYYTLSNTAPAKLLHKTVDALFEISISFKLPGAPFTSWLTLLFLLSVLVLMAFDYPNGTYTIAALPIIGILLVIGWFGVRKRVAEIHSTAPVVEEDEEKQEIVFKPETSS